MIHIPTILCQVENHYRMALEYICMDPQCLKNTQQLACIYCCQQLHKSHISHVQALKAILVEFKKAIKPTEYGAAQILLKGISRCRNQRQFHQNISELINYKIGGVRFEKIIDRANELLKEQTKQFYEKRNSENENENTVKKGKKESLTGSTSFIQPVLTFTGEDAAEQGYQLKSPFCVVNSSQKLVTAFAHPPLNRFQDSIEMTIKIQKITPFWMGIGLSVGKKLYEPQSKSHILLTSNGWVSQFGKLTKTQLKYCLKDTIKLKLDKRMQLLQFTSNNCKHTVQYSPKWNEEVYLCCILFYKNDSVQIMA